MAIDESPDAFLGRLYDLFEAADLTEVLGEDVEASAHAQRPPSVEIADLLDTLAGSVVEPALALAHARLLLAGQDADASPDRGEPGDALVVTLDAADADMRYATLRELDEALSELRGVWRADLD